jgi:hypothetical protein
MHLIIAKRICRIVGWKALSNFATIGYEALLILVQLKLKPVCEFGISFTRLHRIGVSGSQIKNKQ